MSAKIKRLRDRLNAADGLDDDERDDFEDALDEAEDHEAAGGDIGRQLDRFTRHLDRAISRVAGSSSGGGGVGVKAPPKKTSSGTSSAPASTKPAKKSGWFGA